MSKKVVKRLVMINNFYSIEGGTEAYQLALARAFCRSGYEVALLYQNTTGREPKSEGWHLLQIDGLFQSPSGLQAARSFCDEFEPDVVHLNFCGSARFASGLSDKWPLVYFLHSQAPLACAGDGKYLRDSRSACERRVGPYCLVAPYLHQCSTRHPLRHWHGYWVSRELIHQRKQFSSIVVASQYMRQELLRQGFNDGQIVVAPLFMEAKLYRSHVEQREASGRGQPARICFGGRLVKHKGADVLLEALRFIEHSVVLEIIGDGAERQSLEVLAARVNGRHRVEFRGRLANEEVLKRMAQSTLVAVPSLWPEPFGLIGLEAMSQAKPVVAFDVGGIREWLEDGKTGLLAKPGNAQDLAAKISRLLDDQEAAQAMGLKGFEKLGENFSVDRHAEILKNCYQDAWIRSRGLCQV